MAVPNEVRITIRRNVLILKTFTVPQLEQYTGMNRQSIHSELRRMLHDGIIKKSSAKNQRIDSRGGRPAVIYELTTDREKQYEILESIKAFYVEVDNNVPTQDAPSSNYFYLAKEELNSFFERIDQVSVDEKKSLYKKIFNYLNKARIEEGIEDGDSEIVQSYIDFLEANSAIALLDAWEGSIQLINNARKIAKKYCLHDLNQEIETRIFCLVNQDIDKTKLLQTRGKIAEVEKICDKLHSFQYQFKDLPALVWAYENVNERLERMKYSEDVNEMKQRTLNLIRESLNICVPLEISEENRIDLSMKGSLTGDAKEEKSNNDDLYVGLFPFANIAK